jgi:hypothetical protein
MGIFVGAPPPRVQRSIVGIFIGAPPPRVQRAIGSKRLLGGIFVGTPPPYVRFQSAIGSKRLLGGCRRVQFVGSRGCRCVRRRFVTTKKAAARVGSAKARTGRLGMWLQSRWCKVSHDLLFFCELLSDLSQGSCFWINLVDDNGEC